jgi:hypothetical protein
MPVRDLIIAIGVTGCAPGKMPRRPRWCYAILCYMDLNSRDRSVVQLVARFNQATSSQIKSIVFPNTTSKGPCTRALGRLTERRYLARIERARVVGGSNGGSGQYVYQLGPAGHKIYKEGRYFPSHTVSLHTLTIVDAFGKIIEKSRQGDAELVGYATEPDCWVDIGRHVLKPDLFVELSHADGLGLGRYWLEIDMSTQAHGQIRDKLSRYWGAYNVADPNGPWATYPLVVFVAIDQERYTELVWLLTGWLQTLPDLQDREEARQLFRITTVPELSTALL